jgi:hypothetical protein
VQVLLSDSKAVKEKIMRQQDESKSQISGISGKLENMVNIYILL